MPGPAFASVPARVEVFSPQGTIKGVRQAAVRFSAPMVALGDPRGPEPFTIDCAAKGTGRWADDRNWIYDFDADLPGGLGCTFTLKAGLKTLAGSPFGGKTRFAFNTGGPSVRAILPYEGSSRIDENQVFLLGLDAPMAPASIPAHAWCAIEGLGEQVPVQMITGEEREKLLKDLRGQSWRYQRLRGPGDGPAEAREAAIVALRCQRTLPAAHQLSLVWGKGMASPSGLVTGKDQVFRYHTRPAFTARFSCRRSNAKSACLPMMDMRLSFSAPLPATMAKKITLAGPGGERRMAQLDDSDAAAPTLSGLTFKAPFAANAAYRLELPEGLHDDAGRALQNATRFPLSIQTDGFPPLVKFAGHFGIIEARAGAALPVTVRNIEPDIKARLKTVPDTPMQARVHREKDVMAMLGWMENAAQAGQWRQKRVKDKTGHVAYQNDTGTRSFLDGESDAKVLDLPRLASDKAFEVIGIPLRKPGFYVVEIKSEALGAALLGRKAPRYVMSTALVTDMAVHFLWGRESSLVWVTALHSARPVKGAAITVADSCTGKPLWNGQSDADGQAHISASLPAPSSWGGCRSDGYHPLVISAEKGDDFSFALSTWNNGIAPYEFDIQEGGEWQADFARTVMDRTLLRAGQTVSMKHFVRRHTGSGFALPPDFKKKTQVRISDDSSGQKFFIPVSFDANGSALSQFTVPKDARLGYYSIAIKFGDDWKDAGRFRVEAFKLPTMEAIIQGPAKPLIGAIETQLDVMVRYLSGGGASGMGVKLRTVIRPVPARFKGYESYHFAAEPLTAQSQSTGQGEADSKKLLTGLIPARLDGEGAARLIIADLPSLKTHARLTTELEYRDANGQVLTKAAHFDLWPAALALGLKTDGWAASTEKVKVQAIALKVDGSPAPGTNITVKAYSRQRYSYRKRLIGGFYSYETTTRITPLDKGCTGKAGKGGNFSCSFAPGRSGEMILLASTKDKAGRSAEATTSVWVAGNDDWWFAGTDGNRMDLLIENAEYNGGDTARIQVRSPFRKATALVAIEREGVLDSFVTTISGKHPVIQVPVKGAYAPNVYVSVLAVRGRTSSWQNWLAEKARQYDLPLLSRDGGKVTAQIDLAKPAWRLGLAKMRVGWRAHRLNVSVTPDKKTYAVRETGHARIKVSRADGGTLPPGGEVAFAVVDDALLQLMPNKSWDLLAQMMDKRGLEVLAATAQMQVVGKRHYGRKAVAHGGGGGRANARELFDTLIKWQGRVKLDENGEAQVDFTLNDSLSRFSLVAIAADGLSLFGKGDAAISATQDLQMLSGLPKVVRENDRFAARFTVRNASKRPMSVIIGGGVSAIGTLMEHEVLIPPGGARSVSWDVLVPYDVTSLEWRMGVREKGGKAKDALTVRQKVGQAVPVRTYQATLRQLDAPVQITMARPNDALAGRGGIDVRLRARLGDGLDGVRRYMSDYPFACFEQRTSIAIALEDKPRWQALMRALPGYLDEDGLLKYWPTDVLQGSDTLTSYVLAISDQAGWSIPDAQRNQMLDALQGFVEGRLRRGSPLRTADQTIRKLAAIAALSRYHRARAAMLTSLAVDANRLPTSAVLDWMDIVRRVKAVPGRGPKTRQAQQILRSRLDFQGTRMGFSTAASDNLWWLMVSSDSNAARVLLSFADVPQWRADMGRMARGLLQRQSKGHWRTTTANAWGTLAMRGFSKRFEREKVSGQSRLELGSHRQSLRWDNNGKLHFAPLSWPTKPAQLALTHDGTGTPWAFISASAAIPLKAPLSTGYAVTRSISPVSQATPGEWRVGDVLRVHLAIKAQTDMSWVAVSDPVPAGAQILGGGLGGDSALLTRGEAQSGRAWPVFEERRADAYQAFYRFVPKGDFSLDYTLRLNTSGDFNLPPVRVEAMYAPEMFGETPIAPLHVEAQK